MIDSTCKGCIVGKLASTPKGWQSLADFEPDYSMVRLERRWDTHRQYQLFTCIVAILTITLPSEGRLRLMGGTGIFS